MRTFCTGIAPATSGSLSHVAWYHDSSGTIHTPAMHAGAVATPACAHVSSTTRSLPAGKVALIMALLTALSAHESAALASLTRLILDAMCSASPAVEKVF